MKELPEADAVCGIGWGKQRHCRRGGASAGRQTPAGLSGENPAPSGGGSASAVPPSYFAYLKIAEGCSNGCAYCAIPMIRGRYRSRTMESVVAEAEKLAADGARELILIAQDTTRGQDLYGEWKLPSCCAASAKSRTCAGSACFTATPDAITDELLTVMAEEEKNRQIYGPAAAAL